MNPDTTNPKIPPPVAPKEPAPDRHALARPEDHIYAELSRVHHELASLQRELARTQAGMAAAQAELATSEQRYRSLMECSPIGIFEFDSAGRCVYTNSHWQDISGLSAEESLGDGWKRALDPQVAPAYLRERILAQQSGREFNREVLFRTKQGDQRWAQVRSRAVPGHGGRVSTVEDITERKQAESQLRKLSRAVEQCPVSIVITDLQGAIEYVNPKFCAVTGYRFEEARGQNPRVLKSGDMPAGCYRQLWATITAGQEWRGEFHNRKKNGELYWESASISPIRDDTGKVTHFVAVKEDITRAKQAQAEREDLERQVAEHTAREQGARLALEHEQKSSQLKSRFVRMVSHEFRTPMSVINVAIEMLDTYWDKMTGDERTEQLKEIQCSVERMTQMMNDFLLHDNCASGKVECQPVRVEVAALCRRLIAEVTSQTAQPRPIECLIDPGTGQARLDENILRHILGNLLSNAVKYSSDGQAVKLEVNRVAASVTPNQDRAPSLETHLEFKITDSGIGIPEGDMAKLYQTFHRAANVGNRPGTGMGLAIVKQFVELLEGKIRVESKEGKGTTVWVELPVASSAVSVEAEQEN